MSRAFYYAARAAGRAAVRERTRVIQANQKTYVRQQKEAYLNLRLSDAEKENERIKRKIEEFINYCEQILKNVTTINFDNLKKQFIPKDFVFRDKPMFIDNSSKIVVPKEIWIEKIFKFLKKKRLILQKLKQDQMKVDRENYENLVKKYEKDLEQAKIKYNMEEASRKKDIDDFNFKIDNLKTNYLEGNNDAITNFYNIAIKENNINRNIKFIKNYQIKYFENTKKIILEINLNNVDEYIKYSGYKYVKSRDSIEPVLALKKDVQTYLLHMLSCVTIGYLKFIFNNDIGNNLNEVIVNSKYYDNYFCSILMKKESYIKIENKNELIAYENYIKIPKTLNRPIIPYEIL